MELYWSTFIPRLKSYKEISKNQKNLRKNKKFMSELYSFSKATRFFSKSLYQTSPYAIPVLLRMVNLKQIKKIQGIYQKLVLLILIIYFGSNQK